MRAGVWRSCALALLLLFVQQLALSHALDHVGAQALQLQPADDAGDCPECLALAGLHTGAAIAGSPWLLPVIADDVLALPTDAGPARRPSSAHAIRAPPKNAD